MAKDDAEFEVLHQQLEERLSKLGVIYQRGKGDILVVHDYHGNREIGVILLREFPEFELFRIARECLRAVSPGWQVWFTADRSLGERPSRVVTLETIRNATDAP
ncbi:MAG TPA: hypothetical protein VL382_02595 [Terriglobales bacterium]|jgi:hypothetical protein|nr:hypothetical protein [Terriglobales bacterium]